MAENLELLISFIGKDNIVDDILDREDGENTLRLLGQQVIETAQRDHDSMCEWPDMVEQGQDIARQDTTAKSEPWEGASNYKDPVILEAAITFGDRATTELLRGRNLFKVDIVGKDATGAKKAASERVAEFMNWQINHQMEDWRGVHRRLLYQLPAIGTVFKRTFFDPIDNINKSELIHYPNFAVNQATVSLKESPFTIYMDIDKNGTFVRQASGMWSEDVEIYSEGANGDEGSNAEEDVDFAYDNDERFLQQDCFYDLDEDGYQEPYTVTVHGRSGKVVRIVARFDETSITVKTKEVAASFGVDAQPSVITTLEFGGNEIDGELIKIEPSTDITKYGFIHDPEGTYLDIGYYHLLSSITKSINSGANQLSDAGTLANLQGGYAAKGFRKRMGNMRVKPGSWVDTDIRAQDLQTGLLPHQFKEPSPTLLALVDQQKQRAKELTSNLDLKGLIAPNAPATTTLGLMQEAMVPMSAILQGIISAESAEFKKLFVLNSKFTDPDKYQKILDDSEADFEVDFDLENMDIQPTANADLSSKMQRIQQAESMMFKLQIIQMGGGDSRPIVENWFEAIGADNMIDKVWPSAEDMSKDQESRIQQQQAEAEKQNQLQAIEIDLAERKQNNEDRETQAKLRKTAAELDKLEAETIKVLEEAETEATKNLISKYTTKIQGARDAIVDQVGLMEQERKDRSEARENRREQREIKKETEVNINV